MKPIKTKDTNMTIAKNQPEYLPLPAHVSSDGVVTTCWEFSFKDKLKALFLGRIYLQILSFGKRIQPVKLTMEKHE